MAERRRILRLIRTQVQILMILAVAVSCSRATDIRSAGPSNLGVVLKGKIYRGAQPMGDDYDRLRKLGIRTVLKLNTSRTEEEMAAVATHGMRFIHIPFDAATIGRAGSCDDVARALDVIRDKSNWPIYVHCSRGRDRTGYLIGLYREQVQSWSWAKVDEELGRYGHDDRLKEIYPQIAAELEAGAPTCRTALSGIASAADQPRAGER